MEAEEAHRNGASAAEEVNRNGASVDASRYLHLERLELGGATDRFQRNLHALRLLHELEQSGRAATRAEQVVLAHFSAFGESQLLDRLVTYNAPTKRYEVAPAYRSFLSEHALRSLRTASLTAFYTPLDVISVLWEALLQRGLADLAEPRILEPACGVGAFLTAMPPALRARARITAIELDRCAALMTAQIHPDITLHAGLGYETIPLPDAGFDLAISNVPFGAIPVLDRELPPVFTRAIHDYFFGKTLRVVRPGGLIVFLTSWGTLDKRSATVRRLLHAEAELLGAFRLPSGIFESTSGSHSGADLLILRRRVAPLTEGDEPGWLSIAPVTYDRVVGGQHLTHGARSTSPVADDAVRRAQRVEVNQHWIDHPTTVIGTPRVVDQNESLWLQVTPPGAGIAHTLAAALDRALPPALWQDAPAGTAPAADRPARVTPAPTVPASFAAAIAQLDARERPQFEALADLYTVAKELLAAELAGAAADVVDALRAALNRRYDGIVARWGVLSHPRLRARLRRLPELRFLQALETNARPVTVDQWRADKAAIFTTRTVRPHQAVLPGTLTIEEALAYALNERGGVDLDRIAFLSGLDRSAALAALGDRVFHDPATRRYETADAYLSGDVRVKLQQAERAAASDARYAPNVVALQAVQPAPLGPAEIIVSPAAIWLPDDVLTAFVGHLLPAFSGTVRFNHGLGAWVLNDPFNNAARSVEATSKWGTPRADAIAILKATLDNQPVTIYDEIGVGQDKRRVFNATETVAAQDKQAAIRAAFTAWVWADPARAERLCAIYNTCFNSVRLRRYDGSHLRLPGMNTTLLRAGDLDPYQKDGVWQVLQSKATLLSFDTGGGKTWTACTSVMESIRLGLASKALIVVPNNLVGQWADAFQALYPAANLLAMTPDDFETHRRGVALSRITTGAWDAVIIGETSLKFLPISESTVAAFREAETDRLRSYLEELRATAHNRNAQRSLRQIQQAVKNFETRLAGMEQGITRDSARTITWDELGIDMVVVDEAHCFPHDTPVLPDRGSLPIGQIVDQRLPVRVLSYNPDTEALEWKPVTGWFNNPVTAPLVRVEHAHGSFVCTANHKIWTEEDGYVAAAQLQPHHHLQVLREAGSLVGEPQQTGHVLQPTVCRRLSPRAVHAHQALRAVRSAVHLSLKRRAQQRQTEVLRQSLRGNLACSAARTARAVRALRRASAWSRPWKTQAHRVGPHENEQSHVQSGVTREDAPGAQGPHLFGARRQRNLDRATATPGGGDGTPNGVCDSHRARGRSVPIAAPLLQGGPGRSSAQAGDRGRWQDASAEALALSGPTQDRGLERARVVGVTVLERGGAGGSAVGAGADSRVYCLEVADHHNFFAEGVLVSNCFKNLWIPSRLSVPGVPKGGSQRALDCRIKTWDLLRRSAKVVFLTATPVMNTIAEVYVMQRFLQQDVLDAAGIPHFDAWVSLFGEIAAAFEMKPDGSGFRMHTRLRSFVNMPDLGAMWRQCLNVRTKAEMQLPEPRLVTDKPIPVAVPASPALKAYVQRLAQRAEAIRNGRVKPHEDNMLLVTGDGRKAALDLRLALPGLPRQHHTKIDALVARIATIYTTFAPLRATQLVFCDLATPKGRADRAATSETTDDAAAGDTETAAERQSANFVYHEIKAELVARGIPADEIAFIHDYDQPARKAALFAAMRDGRMRVLIGSTAKMSTGMNVQDRLIALHHLDCPWRPGDLHQRDGRIQRQGNLWPQVYVFRYITEGSFDGYSWQTIETKARFIEQIMSGTLTQRRIDDVSEFVLSAAEVKAIASGNPLVLRKVALELELSRMERVRAVHERTRFDLMRQRDWLLRGQEQDRERAAREGRAQAALTDSTPFRVELCRSLADTRPRVITNRVDADAAIWQLVTEAKAARAPKQVSAQRIGSYRGLELWLDPSTLGGLALWLAHAGTYICSLTVGPEVSAFRSADAQIRATGERIAKLEQQQADRVREIAAIDDEVARLTAWEGQAAYDAAVAELTAINVQFAELEETSTAASAAPTTPAADAAAAGDTTTWYAEVCRLARLHAHDGTLDKRPVILPPATESLALMAELLLQQAPPITIVPVPLPPTAAEQLAAQFVDQPDPVAVIAVTPRSRTTQMTLPTTPQQFAWDF